MCDIKFCSLEKLYIEFDKLKHKEEEEEEGDKENQTGENNRMNVRHEQFEHCF